MGSTDKTSSKILREPNIEFWQGGHDIDGGEDPDSDDASHSGRHAVAEDPPSQLIGQFLHGQTASRGDVSLDMDLEMDELRHEVAPVAPVPKSPAPLPPKPASDPNAPKEIRVSFHPPGSGSGGAATDTSTETPRRHVQHRSSPSNNDISRSSGAEEEVLKPAPASSFRKQSTLLLAKTRSRLMDPPEESDLRSGRGMRSGPLWSGMLGRAAGEDNDEDDLLLEEDLPEEYKKANLSAMTLLQWVSLFSMIAALVCTLTIPILKGRDIWKLKLWKWEVMVLVLICGRLVSGWVIRVLVFFIERNFMLRKRVLYFVYGIRKAVQNCLWLGLVLIAWHALFGRKVRRETRSSSLEYVTKVLVCLLVATLLWLVKTLIIKVFASSFQVSIYFDRIQQSLFNQYVIETLSGPPNIEIQRIGEEVEKFEEEVQTLQNAGAAVPPGLKPPPIPTKSGRIIGSGGLGQKSLRMKNVRFSRAMSKKDDDGITINHLHRLNPRNVSAWNMKRLINMISHGVLSTLDEQTPSFTNEDESATLIRSENEAKAAARKIFQNVAKPGSKYIYLEDLMRFMQEDEALKTMSLIEGADESEEISKSALKNWLVNAFRERRALALTLNDTKTAVHKLHRVINVIVGIIVAIIWLLILGIATSKFLLFLSSQLVLVAFIFGNSCKTVFEAIIFLFVMHPFDVGDRVEVDQVQMVVEEMNILTTVFLRYDEQKIVYPNSILSTKAIGNYYRSPDMGDAIEFCIHVSTPAENIAAMKHRIKSYIEIKKEHWYPSPMIIMKDLEELKRVRMAVWPRHRMNHQDMDEKWVRRGVLIEEMVKIFKELDIQYRLLPIDINVRALPPVNSARVPPGWTTSNS
ncbi:mechanosensitive ion channel protein 5-like [Punica granatum]|uniref:Mechanosensitive ion channel protein n=1 Tax=Punica granatum TaxID=22663 RepID=A0A6P8D0C6_PUNGR|nr:mechanosensitive ion channel protein 5-like [Punica granatum]XP_031385032.1 mechanosensitive ion channel protein 5-like [Punica granatum]XP_031385033.1 mechanosensitive ion channel protein 5-like [Punica granatum]